MAFQPINFANIEPIKRDIKVENGLGAFLSSLMQGVQAGASLANIPKDMQAKDIANAFNQQQVRDMRRKAYQSTPEGKLKEAKETYDLYNKESGQYGQENYSGGFPLWAQQQPQQTPEQMRRNEYLREALGIKRTQEEETKRAIDTYQAQKNIDTESSKELGKLKSDWDIAYKQTRSGDYKDYPEGQGRGAPSAIQIESNVLKNIKKDNPNFDDNQIWEAFGSILDQKTVLPDGSKIKVSKGTEGSLDQYNKTRTTAGMINNRISASQAEKEMPVLTDYISKAENIYPFRLGGFSIAGAEDIAKAANGDQKSIDNLSTFLSAQVVKYELTNLQQLLSAGKTTVSAMKELMPKIESSFNSYGIDNGAVKAKTIEKISEITKKAFEARKSQGIGASAAFENVKEENKDQTPPVGARIRTYNQKTGRLE